MKGLTTEYYTPNRARMKKDYHHPVWDFLRFLVVVAAITVVLWRHASTFDITEYQAIMELAMVYFVGQFGAGPVIRRVMRKYED